jgi:H+-transporting ATPase
MYLKLSVAGHLTIFLTRTRGPFWSIRPARILWVAVLGTQAVATCIAIFGIGLVTPLGWYWALLVWGYALAWALVNDRAKLLTYWVLDALQAKRTSRVKSLAKPATGTGTKSATKSATKAEPKAAGPKPEGAAKPDPVGKAAPNDADKAEATAAAKPIPAPSDPPPHPANTDMATLLDTKLGDIILANVLKDPKAVAHLVTEAIAEAESSDARAKAPQQEAQAEP